MLENTRFEYVITEKCNNGSFCLSKDNSLLYSIQGGNFSILPCGDWRFELNVDGNTGKCINFQGQLHGSIINTDLNIPQHKKGDLYFYQKKEFINGSGCHYFPLTNNAYYDSIKKVLCVGNPFSNGVAIEFTNKIIAVVCNDCLTAIYLDLKDARME